MYTMRKVALDESIEDVVGNNVAEVTGIISSEVVYDHIIGFILSSWMLNG